METFLHDVCVIERERTGCVSLDIAPTCIVVIQVVINTITIYEEREGGRGRERERDFMKIYIVTMRETCV